MPTWVQGGGLEAWIARCKDPRSARALIKEMQHARATTGKICCCSSGGPRQGAARRLQEPEAEAADRQDPRPRSRGCAARAPRKPRSTWSSRTTAASARSTSSMSEDNVKREVGLPWMSFGSDEGIAGARRRVPEVAVAPARLRQCRAAARPLCARRACGDAAGRNPPADLASRRPTSASAARLRSKPGYYADVVVFDPARRSRTMRPSRSRDQLATGVEDVFINGVQVLKDGRHTGAKPGRVVRGPGWTGWPGGGACR